MLALLFKIWQAVRGLPGQVAGLLQVQAQQGQTLQDIEALLVRVLEDLEPQPAARIRIDKLHEDGTLEEDIMADTIRDDQIITYPVSAVDKKGKPALLDGVPTATSSDETVLTAAVGGDATAGFTLIVTGVAPGSARAIITGDGDLGSGVTPVTGIADITVTGGGAATFTLGPGVVTDQP